MPLTEYEEAASIDIDGVEAVMLKPPIWRLARSAETRILPSGRVVIHTAGGSHHRAEFTIMTYAATIESLMYVDEDLLSKMRTLISISYDVGTRNITKDNVWIDTMKESRFACDLEAATRQWQLTAAWYDEETLSLEC